MQFEASFRLWVVANRLLKSLTLLTLAFGVWAVGLEPRWVAARKIEHYVNGWQGPEGLKVVVASDWHFTRWPLWRVMTPERARQIVQDINASMPDVILLPGDFIADRDYKPEGKGTPEDEIAGVLGGLRARLGVYAVLGNHDWWHDGPSFKAALERHGIHVVDNMAKPLPGTAIWVAGIGDDFTGHAQPARLASQLPTGAQALVLMHDPAPFENLQQVQGLVVAGHTHGGQVRLPGIGALIVPGRAPRSWSYGWVEFEGRQMYVTSGLGVSILPIRFNMRPEWVLFTLRNARQPTSSKA